MVNIFTRLVESNYHCDLHIYKIIVSFESVGFYTRASGIPKQYLRLLYLTSLYHLYKLLIVVLPALYPRYSTMANNNLEDEVTFIRRTRDRLQEQGVEPRPIDPHYSTLRYKSSTTKHDCPIQWRGSGCTINVTLLKNKLLLKSTIAVMFSLS